MTLTHDGEIFVYYAKSVLAQVDNIESMFSEGKTDKQRFFGVGSAGAMLPTLCKVHKGCSGKTGTPRYTIARPIP